MPFPYPSHYIPNAQQAGPPDGDTEWQYLETSSTSSVSVVSTTDLDCKVVQGPGKQLAVSAGSSLRWTLINSGFERWPASAELRLIGGTSTLVEQTVVRLPTLLPGETFEVHLRTATDVDRREVLSFAATAEGRLFGELLLVELLPSAMDFMIVGEVQTPACIVLTQPGGPNAEPINAFAGEHRSLEWTLANIGCENWPTDMRVEPAFRSPGLFVPTDATGLRMPAVPPGTTVQVRMDLAVSTEQAPGRYAVSWHVTSASFPDVVLSELFVDLDVKPDNCAAQEATTRTTQCSTLDEPPANPELCKKALEELSKIEWRRQEPCCSTMMKILNNIRTSPAEPKFRSLPKQSKRLVADVLSAPGGLDFLLSAGFVDTGEALLLPTVIESVSGSIARLEAFARTASMAHKRQERDAKIQQEKERKKSHFVNKPRLDDAMKATLARVREDQEMLSDVRFHHSRPAPANLAV